MPTEPMSGARTKSADGHSGSPRPIGRTTSSRYVRSRALRLHPLESGTDRTNGRAVPPMSADTRAGFEALLTELTRE